MSSGRKLTSLASLALLATAIAAAAPANAEDRDTAKGKAVKFLESFGERQFRTAFREQTSRSLRRNFHEEAFVAQASLLHRQLGGSGSNRRLIDERPMSQMPIPNGAPLTGTFYIFRFKTRYPAGDVYEDASLEKENDGRWKIVGFYFYPASD